MHNNPLIPLTMLVGTLLLLSLYARLMHQPTRHRVKRVIRNLTATMWWYTVKAVIYCIAIPCNYFDRLKRSARFSPHLYLPQEPFEGKLPDYIRAVASNPAYAETVKEKLLRIITRKGIDWRRTFEVRYLTGHRDVCVYNAFSHLVLADPLALHDLVQFLRYSHDDQILVLTGDPASGKTELVYHLERLLSEAEPTPLLINELGIRMEPLRLLHAIPLFAERYADTPREVAIADMLEELGFDKLLEQKKLDGDFANFCEYVGVPMTLQGIASIKGDYFATALRILLGIHHTIAPVHADKLVRYEGELLTKWFWMPQDAQVRGLKLAHESGYEVLPLCDRMNMERSVLFGDINLAWFGRHETNDAKLVNWDGSAQKSNYGVLVVDEAFKHDARTLEDIFKLALEGKMPLPNRRDFRWQGLLILASTERETRMFRNCVVNGARVDRMHILRLRRCMEISRLEIAFQAVVDEAAVRLGNRGYKLEVDPVLVPLLARVTAVSEVAEEQGPPQVRLDLIDPTRGFVCGLSGYDLGRDDGSSISLRIMLMALTESIRSLERGGKLTREDVIGNLVRRGGMRWAGSQNDHRVTDALDAAQEWLYQPHPVLHVKAFIENTWRDRRELLPRLRQWVKSLPDKQ